MKPLSISDDDLCSKCLRCKYSPGEMSFCSLNWPAKENPGNEDYINECEKFVYDWKEELHL